MTDGIIVTLAALALVALGLAIVTLVALHFLPTGYSPIHDAVSAYGVGRYAWGYRTQVVALGVAAGFEVGAFARDGAAGTIPLVWLAVYAVARIAINWTPMDLPNAEPTTKGRLHLLLAVAAFTGIAVSTSHIPTDLAQVERWSDWTTLLNNLGTLVVYTAIGTALTIVVPPLRRIMGLIERLLYATSIVWMVTAAIALIAVDS